MNNSGTVNSQKGDFLKGASVKPTGKGPLSVTGVVSPKKKEEKTTEDKDVTAGIKGGQASLGDGAVKPANDPLAKVSVKTPVQKESTDGAGMFKFDRIWKELTEADDLPIGGDLDAPNANLDGDSFDDDTGDLDSMDGADDAADDAGEEDDATSFLRSIRDQINDFLGEGEAADDDSDLLDDTDSELDAGDAGEAGAPPPADAGVPPAPQTESWQRKTALGPKMSDKVPGKLGKKKGSGKTGKGSLKKNTTLQDAKGKKVPLSKFSPKMSDKVSRLKKGDLF